MSLDRAYLYYNPIPFPVASGANSEENNYRIYCEVRVELVNGSNTFEKTTSFELEPFNGEVVFYLNSAFRKLLTATPPEPDQNTIVENTDRVKRFKVFTGELFNELEEPESLVESDIYTVLLGGVNDMEYTHPPMANWITEKKVLSHLPEVTLLHTGTPFFLSYFVPSAITQLKTRATAYFADGTSNTATLKTSVAAFGQVLTAPIGPTNGDLMDLEPTKTLIYYKIWLADQADNALSAEFTIRIHRMPVRFPRFYTYLNSLGGYDTLYCYGELIKNPQFDKVISSRFLGHNYTPLQGSEVSTRAINRSEFEQSTGYFMPDWQYVSEEILQSDQAFYLQNEQWQPITVLDGGVQSQEKSNQKYQRFKYRFAHKSRVR